MLRRSARIATHQHAAVPAPVEPQPALRIPQPTQVTVVTIPTVVGGAVVTQVGSSSGEPGPIGPALQGMSGQQPGESISDFAARVLAFSKLVAEEEQRQAEDVAELLRQQQEAAEAQCRHQDEAANVVQRLQQDASASRQHHKLEYAATLCSWQQQELQRLERVINETRDTQSHTNRSFNARLDHLEQEDATSASARPSTSQPSTRELEERIDHVVATIDDLGTLARPATISQQLMVLKTVVPMLQQQPAGNSTPRLYKMSNFRIEKLDDYKKTNPLIWWQGFITEVGLREVPDYFRIAALYLNTTSVCQVWLNHLAVKAGVNVDRLHTKLEWETVEALWKDRFIVQHTKPKAANQVFQMYQGSQPMHD
ncbi:hypothetical protein CBR_g60862 [Chara braunii]|uniref:Uncharacterized protein n=1 Tax=Chara braunii TaxID=69332 RepID=A0A388MF85_CHABU|nr:hypothetical protein CBR_g60862 [Chara braunii]|eukprot:GBG93220.1 hypothetical protein CBR_g60862 [Chara braunii]